MWSTLTLGFWRSLPHIGLRNFTAHHLIPTKANHTSYIPSPERRRRRPLSSSHKNEPAAIEPTAHDYLVLKITHPDSRYHEWLRCSRPSTVRSQGISYECGDAHCPVWESRGPEGIRKFRILRGALKIVYMLWIYHLIHGIKIFCFKHFLIYCLPIMSIHSEGWRQENQIVARRRNSFEYKLWLNLKSDILMSNFQLFFLKNIK